MPRSISGVYTLPEPAFVAGTVIQSAPVNSDLSDIASALTQSLATTGVSSMTGPIKAAAGTVTAPSYAFANALGTGWYLAGANQIGWAANGVLAALFNADGTVDWAEDHTFAGDITTNTLAVVATATLAGNPITNFPSGTVMPFNQTAAPTGWTKLLTNDNKAFRCVTGNVGTGGTNSFTSQFTSINTGGTALTLANLFAHAHTTNAGVAQTAQIDEPDFNFPRFTAGTDTSTVGSSTTHLHTADLAVAYVDLMLASKN